MNLSDIGIAVALATFFSGLGAALDHLVLPHQNERLKSVLLHWWNYVDDIQFRDIAHEMVQFYVRAERKIFGHFPSIRWLITACAISLIVTTCAIVGGRTLGLYLTFSCGGNIDQFGSALGAIKVAATAAMSYFESNVDKARLYALNISFDALTLAATLLFLRGYLSIRRFIARYVLVLCDIGVCVVFFYVCVYLAFYLDTTTSGVSYGLLDFYKMFTSLGPFSCTHFHIFTSTLVFSSTIFFPTFTYLTFILFMMTSKLSLEFAKIIAQQVLELGATQHKTVFFYTGILIGIIASLTKMLFDIGKLLVP